MERRCICSSENVGKLETFYSTVDRKRGVTKCYMVGNTISRVCPYLQEWNLLKAVRGMKQGDIIEVKTGNKIIVNEKEIDSSIAIEYCTASGGNAIAFGQASSMINSGSWQTDKQPKLKYSKKLYNLEFRIGFQYMGFRFLAELLSKDYSLVWFIYPKTTEFDDKIIVFSDEVRESENWFRSIYDIPQYRELYNLFNKTFRESNIFYSDDLTGTDFKKSIDFEIRK